jgi:hypothetical protein
MAAKSDSGYATRRNWPAGWARGAARGVLAIGDVLAGGKSFDGNWLIGSPGLNWFGFHAARVRLAHRIAASRRRRLSHLVSPADIAAFARDGFVLKPDFLPAGDFTALIAELRAWRGEVREMVQGDTLTRKITLDEATLARLPALAGVVRSAPWRDLLAYIGGMTGAPHLFIQSIGTHAEAGPPDPQTFLHADTFHPAMKAWLFLTDIEGGAPPLTFVPGSHRLTPARLAWERRLSLIAAKAPDEHTRQGSFRIEPAELSALGLPPPREFRVRANTLIVADTFGFHARGPSDAKALRVELWAYGRRSPYFPIPRQWAKPRRRRAAAPDGAYRTRPDGSAFDPF